MKLNACVAERVYYLPGCPELICLGTKGGNMCILITKEVTNDRQKYKQLEAEKITKVYGVSNHTLNCGTFLF